MELGLKNKSDTWTLPNTDLYVTFHVAKNKEVAITFVCVKIPGDSHSGKVKWT